jgi:hypothetical protein
MTVCWHNRCIVWPLALAQALVWAAMYYSFPALLLAWERDLGWSKAELSGAFTVALVTSGWGHGASDTSGDHRSSACRSKRSFTAMAFPNRSLGTSWGNELGAG